MPRYPLFRQLFCQRLERSAVDEEARGHRELRARERACEPLAHDACRAVGSQDLVELVRTAIRADDHARSVTGEIHDSFGNKARTGCYRSVGERAIEHRAADYEERTVGCGTTINQRDVCSALRAFDRRGFHDDVRQRMEVDDIADERECAAGQSSAAGFLAWVAWIEHRDQRAGARETHRSHGTRRSRADDCDSHSSSQLSALSLTADS